MDFSQLSQDQQRQLLMMSLIQQHQQIAMIGLGKIINPATDEIQKDLGSAKFAIDTLDAFEHFTKGNLGEELEAFLTQTLTNLRLNYADEAAKPDEASSNGESSDTE